MYIRQAEITENPNDLLVEMTEGLQSVATALVEVVYPVSQSLRSHLVHILRSSPGCNPGQEPCLLICQETRRAQSILFNVHIP